MAVYNCYSKYESQDIIAIYPDVERSQGSNERIILNDLGCMDIDSAIGNPVNPCISLDIQYPCYCRKMCALDFQNVAFITILDSFENDYTLNVIF